MERIARQYLLGLSFKQGYIQLGLRYYDADENTAQYPRRRSLKSLKHLICMAALKAIESPRPGFSAPLVLNLQHYHCYSFALPP